MVSDYATLSHVASSTCACGRRTPRESEYTIKLPAGAKVTAMPAASESQTPFGTHKVTVEQVPGGVRVSTTVALTKTRIPVAEYAAFRTWCEQVDRALGQRLVVTLGGAK